MSVMHPQSSLPDYRVLQHPQGQDGRAWLSWLAALLRWPVEEVQLWARRHEERQRLIEMDDHMLHDIGLTRADAVAEWRKAFWQA